MNTVNMDVWLLLDSRSFGGIETHVYWLARALLKRNIATTLVFLKSYGEHPLYKKLEHDKIPFLTLDGRFSTLFKAIKKNHPRLIHTHGYKASIFGKIAGKLTHTPIVSTYHAGEPGSGKLKLYTWLDEHLAWLSTNIAVSLEITARINKNITFIPNFIELPSNPTHTLNNNKIAFVGRLATEKGPDLFCHLRDFLPPNIQLEVFGEGPLQAKLQQKYSSGIVFRGVCPHLTLIWPTIDLLCLTFRHEGLPLAALEAMSFGVPVVAFAVGGLPHLLVDQKNGFIIPTGQIPEMAKVINDFFSMSIENKVKLSERARQTIQSNYSTEVIIPKILVVYQNACLANGVSGALF